MSEIRPLDPVTSIKMKLGLLVGVSVLVSALIVALGLLSGVPWWLFVPIAVALALAVTQLLAVGMTSPLREMTAAAAKMATGDYGVRVRATSNDEVGQLARAFNAMAEDLATVDQQRRDLVATVAHEIRTPLTALKAHLENLADGVRVADEDALGVAVTQVERLHNLVRDLLELSKIDAGVAKLRLRDIDVSALLAESIQESGAARVEVLIDPVDLHVMGDPDRLRQLFTNVLDNAVRHSPEHGIVRVTGHRDGPLVRLEVADQGAGIPVADRERVFERFGTSDPATGSTGLGLAIARWVATLHGGSVAAVDPVEGESGARLRIELPMSGPVAKESAEPVYVPPTSGPVSVPTRAPSWPDVAPPRRGLIVAAALLAALGAGYVVDRSLGLAFTLILLGGGWLVWLSTKGRRERYLVSSAVLCMSLALVPTLRDAWWLTALSLVAAGAVMTAAVTSATNLSGFIVAALSWPAAALRGLPWLMRLTSRTGTSGVRVARTVSLTVLLVLVFGFLLGRGDALMGHWFEVVLPDLRWDGDTLFRVFVGVALFGAIGSAIYLTLSPPRLIGSGPATPTQRRFEWLVPVVAVDTVFAIFLLAQITAFFGGHDYLRRTTGLTYAEYVHQGFGQLLVATMLTFVVLRFGLSKAAQDTAYDRALVRSVFGVLSALALVVVASALYRMELYQEAYGFTPLRVVVDVFEGWLGLVIAMVFASGLRMRAGWVPRAALLSGAGAVLLLALVNPEAWIAKQNIAHAATPKTLDVGALRGLSADAAPAIMEAVGPEAAVCLMPDSLREQPGANPDFSVWTEDWLAWNWGRARAREVLGSPVRWSIRGLEACRPYDIDPDH